MTRLVPVFALLIMAGATVIPVQLVGQTPAVAGLTGEWVFTVTTDVMGTSTTKVTLEQKGDSLGGQYSSEVLGESRLVGSVKEGKFTFRFTVQDLPVVYVGTIEGNGVLKGTADFGGVATGAFTAKRRPSEGTGDG